MLLEQLSESGWQWYARKALSQLRQQLDFSKKESSVRVKATRCETTEELSGRHISHSCHSLQVF
jgi:hypothetical protein